jgi:DNA-binding transcriptional MerR regulator
MNEQLTLDSILKFLEELDEREENREKKIKELLQWNEAIAKDIKEIEDGAKGIRLADKITTRNELLEFVENESKDISALREQYIEKRDFLIREELKFNEEVRRKVSLIK